MQGVQRIKCALIRNPHKHKHKRSRMVANVCIRIMFRSAMHIFLCNICCEGREDAESKRSIWWRMRKKCIANGGTKKRTANKIPKSEQNLAKNANAHITMKIVHTHSSHSTHKRTYAFTKCLIWFDAEVFFMIVFALFFCASLVHTISSLLPFCSVLADSFFISLCAGGAGVCVFVIVIYIFHSLLACIPCVRL